MMLHVRRNFKGGSCTWKEDRLLWSRTHAWCQVSHSRTHIYRQRLLACLQLTPMHIHDLALLPLLCLSLFLACMAAGGGGASRTYTCIGSCWSCFGCLTYGWCLWRGLIKLRLCSRRLVQREDSITH